MKKLNDAYKLNYYGIRKENGHYVKYTNGGEPEKM
jgi:hypothetical protein